MTEITTTSGWRHKAGIYVFLNMVTGKVYVGSTSDVKTRIGYHRSKLRHGIHDNGHLQKSWNRYGEANFKIFFVQECDRSELAKWESIWMSLTACFLEEYGYNLDRIAIQKLHSEQTKQKIALANKGRKFTEEHRKNLSVAMTGIKHAFPKPQATRDKIRNANLGAKRSLAARIAMRLAQRRRYNVPTLPGLEGL